MNEKKGIYTSEFWLMVAAQLLTLLFASGVISEGGTLEKALALAASILGALGYAVVRGGIKKASTAATALTATAPVAAEDVDPT